MALTITDANMTAGQWNNYYPLDGTEDSVFVVTQNLDPNLFIANDSVAEEGHVITIKWTPINEQEEGGPSLSLHIRTFEENTYDMGTNYGYFLMEPNQTATLTRVSGGSHGWDFALVDDGGDDGGEWTPPEPEVPLTNPLQDIIRFRRRIGDKIKSHTDTYTVNDSSERAYPVTFGNAMNIHVYIDGTELDRAQWAYGSDVNLISLQSVSQGQTLSFKYDFAAYSNAEIDAMITNEGFDGGIVEVLAELMTDSARLYDYSEGATEAKLSQIFDHLKDLLKYYEGKANEDDGYTGDDGKKLGHLKFGKRISPYYMDNRRKEYKDLTRDPLI